MYIFCFSFNQPDFSDLVFYSASKKKIQKYGFVVSELVAVSGEQDKEHHYSALCIFKRTVHSSPIQ